MKDKLSFHHKLPESWGGYRRHDNCSMLTWRTHEAIHILFSNRTPLQRQRKALEEDRSTLDPLVYQELDSVLRKFEKIEIEIYKPEIFNPDKFRNKHK